MEHTEMKFIAEYPNYAVTQVGEVWSQKNQKWLKLQTLSNGYHAVSLFKDGKARSVLVHRLVGNLFVPRGRKDQTCINHKNGDKTDNRASNLEWLTRGENIQHGFATGLHNNSGESHGANALTEDKVKGMRERYEEGATFSQLGREFNVSKSCSRSVCLRLSWKHI